MQFSTFLSKISNPSFLVEKQLGKEAHREVIPKERLNIDFSNINNPKDAAVLALFYPDANNETCFLLTLRASYKGTHSAQISFPGGKKNSIDPNLKQTALRETSEEVGIDNKQVTIIKKLSKTYIPPSNFWVHPYLAISHKTPKFSKNYEVEALIEVKLADLLNDSNFTKQKRSTSYMKNIEVPCFILNEFVVWGATAMILNEIKKNLC